MDFDDFIVCYANNGVTDCTQIIFQTCCYCFICALHIDEEFCTVTKCDGFIFDRCQRSEIHFRSRCCCGLTVIQCHVLVTCFQLFQCAFQNIQQTSAACVYYASLFQYGQHFRCLRQHFMTVSDNTAQECFDIVCFMRQFFSCFCTASCYCQDCTFFGFHYSFVCCFYSLFCCCSQFFYACFFHAFQTFCKATEQLGSDNAGVTSCAAQSAAGCCFCYISRHQRAFLFCFSCCSHNCQGHICTCITIGYREYVHCVYQLFVCSQFVGAGNDHSAKTDAIQCFCVTHLLYPPLAQLSTLTPSTKIFTFSTSRPV